ncbi:hypothetical protein CF319_g926 [Tilletia indica]|nr:hypothetical protein CF319_g926 [Tilletia indica]
MSRKRSAPSAELEQGDETAGSGRMKRPRVSGGSEESAEAIDEPNEDMEVDEDAENQEADVDAFDGEEEDELNEQSEEENEAMMEEIRNRKGDARDRPAEAGVIDRVDLKNFMCHKHLTMKLGQQLNFVIGHNGSGKSAILTGITIALGGKASSTSRGSSLKSFVREGADSAEVILTMRNEGVEAFKPTLYGKRIIIERRIMAQGGTSWKMKNHAGKVVSAKREEIDAYCDHTNIQVDNPMNVLSQDAARQFLSTSHAKDKYSFFLKGTQLNQLAGEYESINQAVAQMKTAVSKHEELLPDLEKQVREAMNRYKVLDKARSRKEELVKLQEQMVWSQVIAKEQEVKQQKSKAEKAKEKLNLVNAEIVKHENALEELDAEIKEVEDRAKASREREAPLREERQRINQEIKAQVARLSSFKDESARLSEQFNQLEEDIKRLQKSIDDEAARLAHDNRENIERLQEQREESRKEREELGAEETDMRQELRNLESATGPLRQQFDELKREISNIQRDIQNKEASIATMNTGEKLDLYGPGYRAVLKSIDNYGRWRQKPLGPLGRYVKVKDERWSRVMESVLTHLLSAFLVTNFDDQQVLLKMIRAAMPNVNVSVLVAAHDEFDFSAGEPDSSILTVRRALEFSDRSVLRAFVNTAKIEKSALVETRVQGDQLVRGTPRNVNLAFSADMYRVSGGVRGSSTQTITQYNGTPRLTTNLDDGIRRLKEELRVLEESKVQKDREMLTIRKQLSDNERSRNDIKNKIPGIGRKIRQLDDRIQQIEDDLREDEPANVAALQENKEEALQEQAKITEEFKTLAKQKEEVKASLIPLQTKSEKIKQQMTTFFESRETFTDKLEKKTPERMKVFNLLQHRKDQLGEKEKDYQDALVRQGEIEAELEDWTAQAEEFCPRVDAPLKPDEYGKKISAIESHAAAARKQGVENIDDVLKELGSKKKALQDARESIQEIRDVSKMFAESLSLRQNRWHQFRKSIAVRARNLFTMHLEHRGYTGSLSFDHDGGKLRLRVQTEDMTKVRRDKDPKSLSGGEKSFATICLLLALWEAIGCPVRCLDEFDVFMDAVNRKISMKMIADTAKNNPATQFVLITPQNMANVNFGPEVRILRMSDPERGQGVLQAGNTG